jgi:hypothetical protein
MFQLSHHYQGELTETLISGNKHLQCLEFYMLALCTDVQICNELKRWFLPHSALSISKSCKLGFVFISYAGYTCGSTPQPTS